MKRLCTHGSDSLVRPIIINRLIYPKSILRPDIVTLKPELIAPCGMNCQICLAYFGYTVSGKKRKQTCTGCRQRLRPCAFIKKHCEELSKKRIDYCFECKDFPCDSLKKLDKRYREKYQMSMIENLEYIKEKGMASFLKQQEDRYRCPECGGMICVHDKQCYTCKK